MSCHCYPFATFVCFFGFQRPTDECAKKPTLTNTARSHPAHALNNIWNLPCFCHWIYAFGPGCGSLALYVFSQHTFSYPTDHLREYLNNNNFTKLFSQTKDIFHLTGHALSCARQPNNIYSNPMNEFQPKIYTYRMSFKILFKVTTIMRHAWQKNGNKTHITGSFFIMRTCVCVCAHRMVWSEQNQNIRTVENIIYICWSSFANWKQFWQKSQNLLDQSAF